MNYAFFFFWLGNTFVVSSMVSEITPNVTAGVSFFNSTPSFLNSIPFVNTTELANTESNTNLTPIAARENRLPLHTHTVAKEKSTTLRTLEYAPSVKTRPLATSPNPSTQNVAENSSPTLPDTTLHLEGSEIKANYLHRKKSKLNFSQTDLEQVQSLTLANLLSNSSTIYMKTNGEGGLATPSFRGTGASHTQVYWNGLPVNSLLNGSADFSTLPSFMNDEINLYYGSSSMLIGSGALGGGISLKTNTSWNKETEAEYLQEIGSFGTYQSFLSAKFGNEKWRSHTKLFYSQSENNYPYLNTANGEQNIVKEYRKYADYNKSGFLQEIYHKTKSAQWALKVTGSEYFRHIPTPIIVNSNNGKESEKGQNLKSVLEYKTVVNRAVVEAFVGFSNDIITYTDLRKLQNQVSKHQTTGLYSNTSLLFIKGDFSLKTGVQANYFVGQSNYYKDVKRRSQLALFANAEYKFENGFSIYGLLREEMVDAEFRLPTPTLGLCYPIGKSFLVKTSLAYNEHLPTLNDLYWVPGGNPNLKPEKSLSGEVALEYIFKKYFNIELAYFHSEIKDWILWQPLNASSLWTPSNLKHVQNKGLEVNFSGKYNWNKILFKENVGYSYTLATNKKAQFTSDESVNKQLVYVPKHIFYSQSQVETPWGYFTWNINFIGDRYTNTSNTKFLPAYILNDVQIGRAFRLSKTNKLKLNIEFKIGNLFNQYYESIPFQPMQGINYHLYAKISLFGRNQNKGGF